MLLLIKLRAGYEAKYAPPNHVAVFFCRIENLSPVSQSFRLVQKPRRIFAKFDAPQVALLFQPMATPWESRPQKIRL